MEENIKPKCINLSDLSKLPLQVNNVTHISSTFNSCSCCFFLSQITDPNQHKRVSVKSNPGFLERLSETAGGTVVGVGLFFLSIYILFTNEVRNAVAFMYVTSKPQCTLFKSELHFCSSRPTQFMLSVTVPVLRGGLCEQHIPWMRVFLRLCRWSLSPTSTRRTTTV